MKEGKQRHDGWKHLNFDGVIRKKKKKNQSMSFNEIIGSKNK
jgi:hypothetical protein